MSEQLKALVKKFLEEKWPFCEETKLILVDYVTEHIGLEEGLTIKYSSIEPISYFYNYDITKKDINHIRIKRAIANLCQFKSLKDFYSTQNHGIWTDYLWNKKILCQINY